MALGIVAWILIILVVLIVLWLIISYNSFISLRNRMQNAWAQIDVQLKRRFDLIPNLMETVKGYMKHEKETLKEITQARTSFMKATDVKGKMRAENQLEGALKTIFAVSENYPQLQASQNFMQLQEELSGTESKIAYARQHFNDSVQTWNNKVESFPGNLIAKVFKFMKKDFLETDAKERENVKVKF